MQVKAGDIDLNKFISRIGVNDALLANKLLRVAL